MKAAPFFGGLVLAVLIAIATVVALSLFYVLGAALAAAVCMVAALGLLGLILYAYARWGRRREIEKNRSPAKLS